MECEMSSDPSAVWKIDPSRPLWNFEQELVDRNGNKYKDRRLNWIQGGNNFTRMFATYRQDDALLYRAERMNQEDIGVARTQMREDRWHYKVGIRRNAAS
jgi:hypothetical protein